MKIHTQVAGGTGLFVNAYAVETAEEIVVIDTSLQVDDTAEFVSRVRALGKPVAVAFHGTHSDTADGHTTQWLSTLDKLATLLADASLQAASAANYFLYPPQLKAD